MLRYPALLKLTSRGPHAVSSWLQGGLGVSADDVAKMVRRYPHVVSHSIVDNLRPKLRQDFRFVANTLCIFIGQLR